MYRRSIEKGTLLWRMFTVVIMDDIVNNINDFVSDVTIDVSDVPEFIVELHDGRILYAKPRSVRTFTGRHIVYNDKFILHKAEYVIAEDNIKSRFLIQRPSIEQNIYVDVQVNEDKCNHLLSDKIPTFVAVSGCRVKCLKCGKEVKVKNTKQSAPNSKLKKVVANDLTINHITDEFEKFAYTFKMKDTVGLSTAMIKDRMLKVYINSQEPYKGKYARIQYKETGYHRGTLVIVANWNYNIDEIKDVEFIYDETIYGVPYIVGINLVV